MTTRNPLLNNPHPYTLPDEQPMTWRRAGRIAYRSAVYLVMLAFSIGTLFIFSQAAARFIGWAGQ